MEALTFVRESSPPPGLGKRSIKGLLLFGRPQNRRANTIWVFKSLGYKTDIMGVRKYL